MGQRTALRPEELRGPTRQRRKGRKRGREGTELHEDRAAYAEAPGGRKLDPQERLKSNPQAERQAGTG